MREENRRDAHEAGCGRLKQEMRVRMREARARLAPEDAAHRAEAAQKILAALPAWRQACRVALYMPIRGETATSLLFRQALSEGKKVFLPRCVSGKDGMMDLVYCKGPDELAPGSFGIMEPTGAAADAQAPEAGPDVLCAPALACDRRGYRLGWGGGYYDRLLACPALRTTLCIGLVYAFQLVPRLPTDNMDARMHGICTEEGMLWV